MRIHKPDYFFLGALGVFLFFGLLTLFSASAPESYAKFGHPYFFFKKQLFLGVLPGLLLFLISLRLDYHFWLKVAKPFFYFSVLLLVLILIPGWAAEFGRVRSWFEIGGFSFQPSELAKLTLILYLAAWLYQIEKEEFFDWRRQLIPFLIVLAVISALLLKQPDVGTLMILFLIALGIYFAGGGKIIHLFFAAGGGLIGLSFLLIFSSSYRVNRLMTFLNPGLDPQGIGYHINQAFLAIGSGGFFGLGWGHSRQKFQYLPEVSADSIFAILSEELGFLGAVFLILLICVILWRGFRIAQKAPDKFGRLIVVGAMIWFGGQAFVNIASMVGLLPLTGLPLPLISHGGSATLTLLWVLGIVGSVSKRTR